MKIINNKIISSVCEKSKASSRKRMNFNLHKSSKDDLQRMLNVLQPDTYLRPHRHLNPYKDETFILLKGRVAVFIFDDNGSVDEFVILDRNIGNYGVDIEAGRWHGIIVLEDDSAIFEVKVGPYKPLQNEDFASWAPEEGDENVITYMNKLRMLL